MVGGGGVNPKDDALEKPGKKLGPAGESEYSDAFSSEAGEKTLIFSSVEETIRS